MTEPGKHAEKARDEPDAPANAQRRQAGNARARRVRQAAETVLSQGHISRRTPRGEVVINSVELLTVDGMDYIEVYAAPGTASGETHFRIFNPPTGVRRPDGSIEEDPIGALAEVLALHGGARQAKRRRFR